jgi:hypothetical protein
MRKLFSLALLATSVAALQGSTLQQLSLDDLIRKSTAIIRGNAQQSYTEFRGSIIYTHYNVTVTRTLKGTPAKQFDLAVPGGLSQGMRQAFAGAPGLLNGQDYVLFLWTSKTGLTQVIGLSQGLFVVSMSLSGQALVTRAAASETMLNASGQLVADSDIQMTLGELAARIQSVLNGGSGQ